MSDKIQVLIVEDSAIVRGLMTRALKTDPGIELMGTAINGQLAIDFLQTQKPDIIILDIEMPVMDGITALPQLVKLAPDAKIIMASTLTLRNAEISMKAMALGATDYLPKPSTHGGSDSESFFRDLLQKVRALAPGSKRTAAASLGVATMPMMQGKLRATPTLVSPSLAPVKAVAIASSTGGPQALIAIFEALKGRKFKVPVFITQHMPPSFTTILAGNISKSMEVDCHEAKDGEEVHSGVIYLAPGDFHMTVHSSAGQARLKLDQNPPENFCRPSADPMFRSLAKVYGTGLLAVVLTGLGADGSPGIIDVQGAGGTALAQDEASSVVYGMPRMAAETGKVSAILPLNEFAAYFIRGGVV